MTGLSLGSCVCGLASIGYYCTTMRRIYLGLLSGFRKARVFTFTFTRRDSRHCFVSTKQENKRTLLSFSFLFIHSTPGGQSRHSSNLITILNPPQITHSTFNEFSTTELILIVLLQIYIFMILF